MKTPKRHHAARNARTLNVIITQSHIVDRLPSSRRVLPRTTAGGVALFYRERMRLLRGGPVRHGWPAAEVLPVISLPLIQRRAVGAEARVRGGETFLEAGLDQLPRRARYVVEHLAARQRRSERDEQDSRSATQVAPSRRSRRASSSPVCRARGSSWRSPWRCPCSPVPSRARCGSGSSSPAPGVS